VVVINASKVKLSGKKAQTKVYTKYSGYPGGLKKVTFDQLKSKNASIVIKHAVAGMLPKNKLKNNYLKRLYVFNEEAHPYKDKVKLVKL
jgi:large subunit ribosomal protein L13